MAQKLGEISLEAVDHEGIHELDSAGRLRVRQSKLPVLEIGALFSIKFVVVVCILFLERAIPHQSLKEPAALILGEVLRGAGQNMCEDRIYGTTAGKDDPRSRETVAD